MSTNCTRCECTGFLNLDQISDEELAAIEADPVGVHEATLRWIADHEDHDVQVCDCCGDGTGWYGMPGEHYGPDDPSGPDGPYAYNGGLCECD